MSRKFLLSAVLTLSLFTSACSGDPAGADIPPAEFTTSHHVLLAGRVLNSAGQPLQGIEVAVPLTSFASVPVERRVSAQGGSRTDATGSFSFLLSASTPRTTDGTADVYVYARKPGDPGQVLTINSVLTTVRLVPLNQEPQTVAVDVLHLRIP